LFLFELGRTRKCLSGAGEFDGEALAGLIDRVDFPQLGNLRTTAKSENPQKKRKIVDDFHGSVGKQTILGGLLGKCLIDFRAQR
jgi:hypothetical protein